MSIIGQKTERFWILGVSALIFLFTFPISAQRSTEIPSPSHYDSYRMIYRGNVGGAKRLCRSELDGATRIGSQRWIDSICYYAILGETEYLSGNIGSALEAYEAAIDLYLSNRDWLSRVVYSTGITSIEPPVVPWGRGGRNVPIGIFPRDALIRIGDPITDERLQQGGIMQNPEMRKIAPDEILRCTALAMRRRNEILGSLAPFDPRSRQIVECFSTRSVSRNHWSVILQDVLFGIALEGAGKEEEAINRLCDSLLLSGQFDHFLTSSALVTLGDLYLRNGKPFEAADSYFEASVSAYAYGDFLLVEEALRKFAGANRARSEQSVDFPYDVAARWASDQAKSPFLFLSLSLTGGEDLIARKRFDEAENGLRPVAGLLKSQGFDRNRYADLYHYLEAILLMRHGKMDAGNDALVAMSAGVTDHSFRFFEIKRLNETLSDLSPRAASDLYERLLRPSDFFDWACDAPTALTMEASPLDREFGNWFLLLMSRDMKDKAFEVAERIRTRRFLNSFEMGGRLFSLRYLLEAPVGSLSEENRVLRQTILLDHSDYGDRAKRVTELEARLKELPIIPDEAGRTEQRSLLSEIGKVSGEQEIILRQIAVERFPLPELFPPIFDVKTTQTRLPAGTSILSFLEANKEIYAFLVTNEILDAWRVGTTGPVTESVASFLTACGATDANKAKLAKEILSESWKSNGQKLMTALLGNPTSGDPRFAVQFAKMAIVPDGPLWYCPFDALSLPLGDSLVPLASVSGLTLEYAPTVSMAFSNGPIQNQDLFSETVLVPGKLFPKEDPDVQKTAISRLEGNLQKPVILSPGTLETAEALLSPRIGRLCVLHEIASHGSDWVPLATGEKFRGDPISAWSFLPWGGPKLAVFPGFRSAAENGMADGGNGSEFFYPLLILESQGAETILISRWRPGGRSTYDLTETFFDALRENNPAVSWKNAVAKVTTSPLEFKEEPRFKGSVPKPVPNGEHPFFWGGFMLIGRGIEPVMTDGTETDVVAPESAETAEDLVSGEGDEMTDEAATADDSETSRFETDSVAAEAGDSSAADDHREKTPESDENGSAESSEERKESSKKGNAKLEPSRPITDEDLEDADSSAEDFYPPGQ